jgi:hypothetical protein
MNRSLTHWRTQLPFPLLLLLLLLLELRYIRSRTPHSLPSTECNPHDSAAVPPIYLEASPATELAHAEHGEESRKIRLQWIQMPGGKGNDWASMKRREWDGIVGRRIQQFRHRVLKSLTGAAIFSLSSRFKLKPVSKILKKFLFFREAHKLIKFHM